MKYLKNIAFPFILALSLGIGAGYFIWGTQKAPQETYGAAYIQVPDGLEDVIIKDGNVNKRLPIKHLLRNVSYVTDTATVDSTQHQSIYVSSASSAILLTLPTAPLFDQCIDLYLDYTASNSIIIDGGPTRDTVTSDQSRTYCYDYANSAWRSMSY